MRLPLVALAVLVAQLPPGVPSDRQAPADARASITVVAEEEGSGIPIGGVKVMVSPVTTTLPKRAFTATTFADGGLQIGQLAPGRYTVTASSSELFAVAGGSVWTWGDYARSIVLAAGENPILRFTFKKAGVITGQVLTPDGKPVRDAGVQVVTSSSQIHGRPVLGAGPGTSTDANGRFTVGKLPPGRYFVRAMLPAPADAPLNLVYAPGTATFSEATPVVLDAGDEFALGITARSVPTVTVAGRVVNAQGEPVKDAAVSLASLQESPRWSVVPVLQGPIRIDDPKSVRTDADGRFVVRSVREGLYALQAVVRGPEDGAPVVAAGVAEVDVRTRTVDRLVITLTPCARIIGRFLFNGLEAPDPARSQVGMQPSGEDAHLRKGLASSMAWHADGTFEVDGILGPHRLSAGSSGGWFAERAVLENGTDIAGAPLAFEPGKVYRNVRVWLSDEAAQIEGPLPEDWEDLRGTILAFPEDASLWGDGSRYVRPGTVSSEPRRFSVRGLPPGQTYLVAVYRSPDGRFDPARFMAPGLLDELVSSAVRIFVGEPGKFEVSLPAASRQR